MRGCEHRQFAIERHHAFDDQAAVVVLGQCGVGCVDLLGESVASLQSHLAAAVVAKSSGLDDAWHADGCDGMAQFFDGVGRFELGNPDA